MQFLRYLRYLLPVVVPVLLALLVQDAAAQIGATSSRVPFTEWLIEFYNVVTTIYFPLMCTVALLIAAWMVKSGRRITEAIGRYAVVIALIGLGVSGIAQAAGGTVNIALLG